MTTAYTWTSLEAAVSTSLVQGASLPADFTTLFPDATSYAEARISRDLVLLNTRAEATITNTGGTIALSGLTPPNGLALPMVVLERIDLTVGSQNYPYEQASLDYVRFIWPQGTLTLAPNLATSRFFALANDATVILAPTPDQNYSGIATGLFVQAPLSSGNSTTYISTLYGDLMFAAVMIFMHGALLRNFGAASDEPQTAVSWEGTYRALLPGCESEEARRRGLLVDDLRAMRQPAAQAA